MKNAYCHAMTWILFNASLQVGEAFVPSVILRIRIIMQITEKTIKTTIAYGDNSKYLWDLFDYQSNSP